MWIQYLNYAFGDEIRGLLTALTVAFCVFPVAVVFAALNSGGKK